MRWLVLLSLLAGCPLCEFDAELDLVAGSTTLRPGEKVLLSLESEGFCAGPTHCRGHWYVNEFEGGNAEIGTITTCGEYTAPFWPRERPFTVTIEATKYALYGCADCCPYGARTITVVD